MNLAFYFGDETRDRPTKAQCHQQNGDSEKTKI